MSNAYLQLASQGKNHWWRYVLGALLSLFCFIAGSSVLLAILIAYVSGDGDPSTKMLSPDAVGPGQLPISGVSPLVVYCVANLSFAFFLLGIHLSLKLFHGRSLRSLLTSATTLSWRRIAQGFGVFFALKVIEIFISYLISPTDFTLNFQPLNFLLFLPLVLVLTPLQTTTEELFFRGYLLQGAGHNLSPSIGPRAASWIAIVSTSIFFTLLHVSNPEVLSQDSWDGVVSLVLYYCMVGAFLAWLTLKERTIELALGLHAANNMATFLLVTSVNSVIPSPAIFEVGEIEATFSLLFLTAFWLWLFSFIVFRFLKRPQFQER